MLLVLAPVWAVGQSPVDWAITSSSNQYEIFLDTSVDETNEQMYAVGQINDANGFDVIFSNETQSENADLQNSLNGSQEGLLLCTDYEGNVLWSMVAGSSGKDAITAVDIDSEGNVHIAGYFQQNLTFTGPSNSMILSQLDGNIKTDGFWAKLSPTGVILNVKAIGTANDDIITDLSVLGNGVYVTHERELVNVFGDVPVSVFSDDITYTHEAIDQLHRLDLSGNVIWTTFIELANQHTVDFNLSYSTRLMAFDGSVYVIGEFLEPILNIRDAQGGNYSYAYSNDGFSDIYVHSYDTDGGLNWHVPLLQSYEDTFGYGIDADADGVYVCGSAHMGFFTPFSFSDYTHYTGSHDEFFIGGLDKSNGSALWMKSSYTNGSDNHTSTGYDLDADEAGNIYVAGTFGVDFNLGGSTLNHSDLQDMMVLAYNNNGDFEWSQSIQTSGSDIGCGVKAFNGNQLSLVGTVGPNLDFHGNQLSDKQNNALLLKMTSPNVVIDPCDFANDPVVSSSTTSHCPGQEIVISNNTTESVILQKLIGGTWQDVTTFVGSVVVDPSVQTTYRLVDATCSAKISEEITINIAQSSLKIPGGMECGLNFWLRADSAINGPTGVFLDDSETVGNWYSFNGT
ncbi:MAG: hypothetical protein AAF193_05245, partial [Bacteroidota bacterium]